MEEEITGSMWNTTFSLEVLGEVKMLAITTILFPASHPVSSKIEKKKEKERKFLFFYIVFRLK